LTHLSVPAPRHYHDVGLLEPVGVDPSSGYRRYAPSQVTRAQLVRRLRELRMPLPDVRGTRCSGYTARDAAVAAHLERMERELDRTREVVASLRTLLREPLVPAPVELRRMAGTTLAIRETVARSDLPSWCEAAFPELYAAVATAGLMITGTVGGLCPDDVFEHGAGEFAAFVPISGTAGAIGRAEPYTLPAADLAIMLHAGPFTDLDRTYGALGSHVSDQLRAAEGPIPELYVVAPQHSSDPATYRTEVCWPVHLTKEA
jgi:DNA-binding transcriptional MerR regulator